MTPDLIRLLFVQIVIPMVGAWMRQRQENGQPPPTKDELLAEMNTRADAVIAAGEAFLQSKGAL